MVFAVRLSGDRAYMRLLRVPVILIVIGLAVTGFGVRLLVIACRRMTLSRLG